MIEFKTNGLIVGLFPALLAVPNPIFVAGIRRSNLEVFSFAGMGVVNFEFTKIASQSSGNQEGESKDYTSVHLENE